MIIFRSRTNMIVAITAACVSLTTSGSAAIYQSWPVGVEREVDNGVYYTLLKVSAGWRVWKLETKNGVECRAVKSVEGRPHPIPIGVGAAFATGTPFLMIYSGGMRLTRFSWTAQHFGKARIQYRAIGEKFWNDGSMSQDDLRHFDGQRVGVSLTSWEYPELLVGYSKEVAVMNFSGLNAAIEAVENCTS